MGEKQTALFQERLSRDCGHVIISETIKPNRCCCYLLASPLYEKVSHVVEISHSRRRISLGLGQLNEASDLTLLNRDSDMQF